VAQDLKIRVSAVRFRPKPLATSMTSAARHASTWACRAAFVR